MGIDKSNVYGGNYRGDTFSGQSKINEAKRRRSETDRIMSPLWVFSPILGGIILFVSFFLSFGFIFDDPIFGGTLGYFMIGGGIIAWVFLVAFPWYLMIKRRTEHFKRDHLLMEGIIEHLEQKQSVPNTDLTQELATLRSISNDSRWEEPEKNPLLYTILAVVIPYVGILYVLYFLMKDVYSHHQRVSAFMENTRLATNKLGESLVVPSWKTLEERNFVVYFLISCLCGLFMYYWMYSIIKDYNEHFKTQWRFEDQLATDSTSITNRKDTKSSGRGFSSSNDGHHRSSVEQRPIQQSYKRQKEKTKKCPDCEDSLRYLEKYDRWYCYDCGEYKSLKAEKQLSDKSVKNHCIDCGNKMRYIEKYDRWYCDNCRAYK